MALDKVNFKNGLNTLLDGLYNNPSNKTPSDCRNDFANGLGDLLETFVKTGTVNVNVATTGTATAQSGTGTGSIT